MDFDTTKMIVTLGYNDGSVEVLKIEKSTDGEAFYYMTKELRVQQRENIVCVTIMSQPECPYIAFVNESNFSGFNYEKRSSPFAKVKVEKEKDITAIRWTKSKYFLAAPLSTEDKKRAPKLYCIEQDVADEAWKKMKKKLHINWCKAMSWFEYTFEFNIFSNTKKSIFNV